jgi:hypothetical protein
MEASTRQVRLVCCDCSCHACVSSYNYRRVFNRITFEKRFKSC